MPINSFNQALLDPTRASLKFTLAQKLEGSDERIKKRALYADVMLDQNEDMLRIAAKNQFVADILASKQLDLIKAILGKDKILGDYDQLDSTHSAIILNHALETGDADLISAIAPHLSDAPNKVNDRDWVLQKARIDIFSGRFEEGQAKISQWVKQGGTLSGEEVDRVLQPVYDLQAVQENEISLELFDLISNSTDSKRHKREILFWKAESYEAMAQRLTAAQFYLRSALVQANGFDEWGQSSRYHAASTLMEAGYHDDARLIFEALLNVSHDNARRATIKQALQRLWLLER